MWIGKQVEEFQAGKGKIFTSYVLKCYANYFLHIAYLILPNTFKEDVMSLIVQTRYVL